MATGKLTMVPNAVVRNITVDKSTGKVNGANFVDRHSRREMHVKARAVVVGASCLESTRILLNSGIANSSGVLGQYLHDQTYITPGVQAIVPEALDGKAPRGLMGGAGYIPRFVNLKKGNEAGFIRGYAFDFFERRHARSPLHPAYGEELEKKLASYRGAGISVTIMGEVLPRYENKCTIDKNVVDAFGIPVLRFDCKYGDNEAKMLKHATDTFAELVRGVRLQGAGENGQAQQSRGTASMK